jgi:hypothetical protein
MAQSNRTIGVDGQVAPMIVQVDDSAKADSISKVTSRHKVWLARLLISLVVLPLPLFTAAAAIIRPQFEANLSRHDARATSTLIIGSAFALFLILIALFAYHAFMFWYDPFVDDDTDLAARKEKVVNSISLALSIPGLGGLALALFTGSSTNGEVSLIEQIAHGFPLQTWAVVLLLTVAVGWLGWWLYSYAGWVQRLLRRPRQESDSNNAWGRLVQQFRVVQTWVKTIRRRASVLISSFLSVGLLMFFLVVYLLDGLGNAWAVVGLLSALVLIQVAGLIAVRLGSRAALSWSNGAMFVMLFGIERLTRGAALTDRPALNHLPAGLLALEVFAIYFLLWWRMRQVAPRPASAPPAPQTARGA